MLANWGPCRLAADIQRMRPPLATSCNLSWSMRQSTTSNTCAGSPILDRADDDEEIISACQPPPVSASVRMGTRLPGSRLTGHRRQTIAWN